MALTAQVKDELARVKVDRTSCRKAEVSATLRFAGGLHIISGRIVIEAELDTAVAADRLRTAISDVYGHTSELITVSGGGIRRGHDMWCVLCVKGSRLRGKRVFWTAGVAPCVGCHRILFLRVSRKRGRVAWGISCAWFTH